MRAQLMLGLNEALGRITTFVKSRGLPDAAVECISRCARGLTGERVVIARSYLLSQAIERLPARTLGGRSKILVRPIDSADAVLEKMPRPRKELEARFSAGSKCFVAEIHGELTGFCWLHAGTFYDWEIAVSFAPSPPEQCVWDFDLYVVPKFRLGPTFVTLWAAIREYLLERGIRWSVSRVWAENDASLRTHLRMGAMPVGSAYTVRMGNRFLNIVNGKHWHLSGGARQAPVLEVQAAETKRCWRLGALVQS